VLALSGVAAAEFVAREKDFRCLLDGRAVAGKHFFVFHRRHGRLRKAPRIAERDLPDKRYPVGTILQFFPFEAMVASLGLSEDPCAAARPALRIRTVAAHPRCVRKKASIRVQLSASASASKPTAIGPWAASVASSPVCRLM